ncbi:MAG: FecR family protein [Symbiopectobacterium sp.]|uniref:FecR family protein n=1 Tax=Symbiopectobacterium sp. TaxID=2952789 RepID=UPI0039EB04C6
MNQKAELARIQQQAAEWQSWCEQDARHERVYRQMQQLWSSASLTRSVRRARNVSSLWPLWWVGLVGMLASQLPYRYWLADQRTAIGEIRRLTLDDGSVLTLNTDSAVNLHFDTRQRTVELVQGEAYARVAKDPAGRPFVIRSAQASAQELGTRYSVREVGEETRVHVEESRVRVTAQGDPAVSVDLKAGQQVSLTQCALLDDVQDGVAEAGWLHNQLVFENAPLSEVIGELDRYHRGVIYLDPRDRRMLDKLRFTGVLPLDDTGRALSLLSHSLPLSYRQPVDAVVLNGSKNNS